MLHICRFVGRVCKDVTRRNSDHMIQCYTKPMMGLGVCCSFSTDVGQQSKVPKVYTKTGDKGKSSLFTGERRMKCDKIFNALGDVDELSCALGLAVELSEEKQHNFTDLLIEIQCVLQDVMSSVATPLESARESHVQRTRFNSQVTDDLEKWIDFYTEQLPPLENFTLPSGGGRCCSALNVTRAICRRAERSLVFLSGESSLEPELLKYINRLSDFLFTLSRYVALKEGKQEKIYRRIDSHSGLLKVDEAFQYQVSPKRNYSTTAVDDAPDHAFIVTLENIFSERNKDSVQKHLKDLPPFHSGGKRTTARLASVLVTMCNTHDGPSLLYTKRSEEMPSHRGEICFPGGIVQNTDMNVEDTALREADEELSLKRSSVDIWGVMPAIPNWNGSMFVTPVIGCINHVDISTLSICDREVDYAFTESIAWLLCADNQSTYKYERAGNTYVIPAFACKNNERVWGLTGIFTHQLLTILAPNLYSLSLSQ